MRLLKMCMLIGIAIAVADVGWAQAGVTPEIAKVVAAWRDQMNSFASVRVAPPTTATVAEQLKFRASRDQAGRAALSVVAEGGLPPDRQRLAMDEIWKELHVIDDDNTAFLESVVPADGWFRISRDGARTTSDAWIIVQHSRDRAFQRRVLAAMAPLARIGEVSGEEYALLYDRNEMFDGRPQRYGSQGTCVSGKMTIYTLEDPARVEEWRRSVGMKQTLAEYAPLIGVGKPC